MNVSVDTNVIVAALSAWHEHHVAASSVLNDILSTDDTLVLAQHVLLECYATLTRLPAPYRIGAIDAHRLLTENFENQASVAVCEPTHIWTLIEGFTKKPETLGGQSYDAYIIYCLQTAGVSKLFTFNTKHFLAIDTGSIAIVHP